MSTTGVSGISIGVGGGNRSTRSASTNMVSPSSLPRSQPRLNRQSSNSVDDIFVYSRRSLQSPVVKKIMLADMSGCERREVVVVKENFIELAELDPEQGTMKTLCTHPTFGIIKDAQILRVKPHVHIPSATPSTPSKDDGTTSKHAASTSALITSPIFIDSSPSFSPSSPVSRGIPIPSSQQRRRPSANFSLSPNMRSPLKSPSNMALSLSPIRSYGGRSIGRSHGMLSPDACARYPFGQDVLVCISDSGFLSFLTYRRFHDNHQRDANNNESDGRFEVVFELRIGDPGFKYYDLGRSLLVDPFSRAIAVATFESKFNIWPTRSLSKRPFEPIRPEECFEVTEDGIIWHLTFLYPKPDDLERVLVAAIVFKTGMFRLAIYEYMRSQSSQGAVKRILHTWLNLDCLPVQMVALPSLPEMFLVITEKEVFSFSVDDLIQRSTFKARQPLPPPSHSSTHFPLISTICPVTYDPVYIDLPGRNFEELYMAGEHGHVFRVLIRQFEIKYKRIGERAKSSHLSILATSPLHETNYCDMLLMAIAGDGCDGEIIKLDARRGQCLRTQTLSNWSPVIDFKLGHYGQEARDALYVTSGTGSDGAVHEIKYGVGVDVVTETDADFEGVSGMWTLRNANHSGSSSIDRYLCIAFASETRVMFSSDEEGFEDVSDTFGFDVDVTSLFAGALSIPGLFVQVHRFAVIIARHDVGEVFKWTPEPGLAIEAACVMRDMVVVSLRKGELHFLRVATDDAGTISMNLDSIYQLGSEPSAFYTRESIKLGGNSHNGLEKDLIIIATYEPSIVVLEVQKDGVADVLVQQELASLSTEGINIPQSFHIVPFKSHHILLAGLRDGNLVSLAMRPDIDSTIQLSIQSVLRVGYVPTQLVVPSHSNSYALVLSNQSWRVRLSPTGECRLEPLNFPQIQIATAFQLQEVMNSVDGGDYMFISGGCLVVASLNGCQMVSMRRFSIGKTPRRVLVDTDHQQIIIATSDRYAIKSHQDPSGVEGMIKSELRVYDLKTQHVLSTYPLPDRECICSLTFWNVKEDKRYIVVGTTGYIDTSSTSSSAAATSSSSPLSGEGRVLVFSLKSSRDRGDGKVHRLKLAGEHKFPSMVSATCTLLNTYLLVAVERSMHMLKIDRTSRKLIKAASYDVRWPITSISTNGENLIAIGSLRDSVTLFKYLTIKKEFEFVASDRMARFASDVILNSSTLSSSSPTAGLTSTSGTTMVASDREGSVYGLIHEDFRVENCLTTTFSAPTGGEVILRLHMGSLQPPTPQRQTRHISYFAMFKTLFLGYESDEEMIVPWRVDDGDFTRGIHHSVKSVSKPNVLYGVSIIGSMFTFIQIPMNVYERLSLLVEVLGVDNRTRPVCGGGGVYARGKDRDSKANSILMGTSTMKKNMLDGEMLSGFLERLSCEERVEIVERFWGLWKSERAAEAEIFWKEWVKIVELEGGDDGEEEEENQITMNLDEGKSEKLRRRFVKDLMLVLQEVVEGLNKWCV